MAVRLCRRQRHVLNYLVWFVRSYGYAPTLQEIADELGLKSLATVHEHLAALVDKGIIEKERGYSRSIQVINPESYPVVDEKDNKKTLEFIRSCIDRRDVYGLMELYRQTKKGGSV